MPQPLTYLVLSDGVRRVMLWSRAVCTSTSKQGLEEIVPVWATSQPPCRQRGVVGGVSPDLESSWQSVKFTDHSAPIFITEVGKECLLWPCKVTTCLPGMNNRLVTPHLPTVLGNEVVSYHLSWPLWQVLEMVGTEPRSLPAGRGALSYKCHRAGFPFILLWA